MRARFRRLALARFEVEALAFEWISRQRHAASLLVRIKLVPVDLSAGQPEVREAGQQKLAVSTVIAWTWQRTYDDLVAELGCMLFGKRVQSLTWTNLEQDSFGVL